MKKKRGERDHPIHSFSSFFRRQLMPTLARFEKVRRRRLPFQLILTALMLYGLYRLGRHLPAIEWVFLACCALSAITLFVTVITSYVFPSYMFKGTGLRANASMMVALLFMPLKMLEMLMGYMDVLDMIIFHNQSRRLDFSREVIARTVEFALPGLKHRPVEYLGQGDFLDSHLYGFNLNRYSGHDYFYGAHKWKKIAFSWLKAEYVSVNRNNRQYRMLFNGWFFCVGFGHKFAGEVLVRPDIAEAAMGWFGRSLQQAFSAPHGMQLVELEDHEFEKRFIVHANSQLEARYILTPTMMRTLTDFQKRLDAPLAISFRNECMFVAAQGVTEYFGLFPTQPFTDPRYARHLYHAVKGVVDLADDINRSHRLWKEKLERIDVISYNPQSLTGFEPG